MAMNINNFSKSSSVFMSIEEKFQQPIEKLIESIDHVKFCKIEDCNFNLCSEFQKYIRYLNSELMLNVHFQTHLFAFQELILAHAWFFCKDKECNLPSCYKLKSINEFNTFLKNYFRSENYDPSKDVNNNVEDDMLYNI